MRQHNIRMANRNHIQIIVNPNPSVGLSTTKNKKKEKKMYQRLLAPFVGRFYCRHCVVFEEHHLSHYNFICYDNGHLITAIFPKNMLAKLLCIEWRIEAYIPYDYIIVESDKIAGGGRRFCLPAATHPKTAKIIIKKRCYCRTYG